MNRLIAFGVVLLAFLVAVPGGESRAADSRDNLPKAAPEKREQAKSKAQPPAAQKPAGQQDVFQDKDNNGVNDYHEKRVMRPEPAPPPTVKQAPTPAAQPPASPPAKAPADPPKAPATPPPATPPPGR